MLSGRLNRLVRRTEGCAKSVKTLVNLLTPVFVYNLKHNATEW